MGEKSLYTLTSVMGTHFTGALAQHAIESESIAFHDDLVNLGINDVLIESITIHADQNLDWDIYLWRDSNYEEAVLDNAEFIDYFNYANASGKQVAATGPFYYASPSNNLDIPYVDLDRTSKLHISLVNLHATAKNAGATGEVVIKVDYRPLWGI